MLNCKTVDCVFASKTLHLKCWIWDSAFGCLVLVGIFDDQCWRLDFELWIWKLES